ncbi:MAG: ACT domain-containing protein [Candidatus Omnitrophica bacterium]|nr:ACT domain-containing protein [Candidatus Omnitrophota bacterium]
MKLTQISVFLENRKGRLHEVCVLLSENRVNIRALTIAESEDFGILRMVVDRPDSALQALKKNGFSAQLTDVVAIEVDDEPGGLAKILKVLTDKNINIEYMYAFVEKLSDKAVLVFRFEDTDLAVKVLKGSGIKILRKEVEEI